MKFSMSLLLFKSVDNCYFCITGGTGQWALTSTHISILCCSKIVTIFLLLVVGTHQKISLYHTFLRLCLRSKHSAQLYNCYNFFKICNLLAVIP